MAKKSTSRFRLGAVLVKRRRPISAGFNSMRRTHPLMQKYNSDKSFAVGLHAEVHCCIGVSASDLEESELYVVRILKNNSLAMARPCLICRKFIEDVGIKAVYFSNEYGQFETLYA